MLTSETGDFVAKVADFGLSAAKQAASATSSASKSASGGAGGGVGGTIEYMAPELHSLDSPTAAADIYGEMMIMMIMIIMMSLVMRSVVLHRPAFSTYSFLSACSMPDHHRHHHPPFIFSSMQFVS